MKNIICALVFATMFGLSAQETKKALTINELVTLSIGAYQEIDGIQNELRAKLGTRSNKHNILNKMIRLLETDKKPSEDLVTLEKMLADQQKYLKTIKKNGNSPSSMNYAVSRIYELQLKKTLLKTKDKAGRDVLLKKLKAENDLLKAEIKTISKPYNDKISALRNKTKPYAKAFDTELKKYALTPKTAFPGVTVSYFNGTMHNAFIGVHWKKADGKRFVWAHWRLRPLSEAKKAHSQEKLDGKYAITSLSENSVWVWAGPVNIAFISEDDSLKGKEKMKAAIGKFIDLEGLSKITLGK